MLPDLHPNTAGWLQPLPKALFSEGVVTTVGTQEAEASNRVDSWGAQRSNRPAFGAAQGVAPC